MTRVKDKTGPIRVHVVAVSLSIAFGSVSASLERRSAQDQKASGTMDSDDSGKAAYKALLIGGSSGFNALLGGGRDAGAGQYARLEAHGFYWTASENGPASAWFYNFGQGSQALYRQSGGEKQMALSVRCVRE